MKFTCGQKVYFRSRVSDHVWKGSIVRPLKDGFYLVDDGTDKPPRWVHGNRLGTGPKVECTQVFA
ncbi:MAG: hypothetical protein ACREDR_05340 [Blastocatellia bacterium]